MESVTGHWMEGENDSKTKGRQGAEGVSGRVFYACAGAKGLEVLTVHIYGLERDMTCSSRGKPLVGLASSVLELRVD